MKRDRQTASDQWRGCHTFKDIICDGDTVDTGSGRDGGLKMGGRYWYYVRSEFHRVAYHLMKIVPNRRGYRLS